MSKVQTPALAPYFKKWHYDGYTEWCTYHPLNMTGRWKLCNGPGFTNVMYIEHKGFFRRSWIVEYDVIVLPERSEQIFDCKGK